MALLIVITSLQYFQNLPDMLLVFVYRFSIKI